MSDPMHGTPRPSPNYAEDKCATRCSAMTEFFHVSSMKPRTFNGVVCYIEEAL